MILGARAVVPFILRRPLSKAWRQRPSRSPATRKKADFVTAVSWARGAGWDHRRGRRNLLSS